MLRRTEHDRVRVYRTVRSAHLERVHSSAPASILYRSQRYDFDGALAEGVDLLRAGPWRAAAVVAVSGVRTLEVNEPLMLGAAPSALLAVLAARWSAAVRRQPLAVVAYAIENRNPLTARAAGGRRSRARLWLEIRAARALSRRIDRLAFGTPGARALYEQVLPGALTRSTTRLIPALPSACTCPTTSAGGEDSVLFVGALEKRKGVPELLRAWPLVRARHPSARLRIIGAGSLEGECAELAAVDEAVEVVIAPPRSMIHQALREASVLVLLSQETAGWREQVGLPIVEALAHGCAVVTTSDTGLGPWLAEHGHAVLPPRPSPDSVAAAITAHLGAARSSQEVLADLPHEDGRLSADAWLDRAVATAVQPVGAAARRRRRSRRTYTHDGSS